MAAVPQTIALALTGDDARTGMGVNRDAGPPG
jgi:hypothetical protein